MPAVALTDHGNMFGAIEFYSQASRAGVKPIIGIEAYVAPGRLARSAAPRGSGNNHLVLLARNETGYRNLIKLTSRSYLEGFYYKPRIDKELLRAPQRRADRPVGLSQGRGHRARAGRQGRRGRGGRRGEFREIFGDDRFYLELQDHGIPEQRQANESPAPDRSSHGHPAGRHQRLPLPAPRRRHAPTTSCSASGPARRSTTRTG